jgi:nitric oxide reductase subunit B
MQQGSIWGHGGYVAPDWSADWLHREALALREDIAGSSSGSSYETLAEPEQARVGYLLKRDMRTNGYNAQTGDIVVSDQRAAAIATTAVHYTDLFANRTPAAQELRELYAMPQKAKLSPDDARSLGRSCSGLPGLPPPNGLAIPSVIPATGRTSRYVGNTPAASMFLWTVHLHFRAACGRLEHWLVLCPRVRRVAARY